MGSLKKADLTVKKVEMCRFVEVPGFLWLDELPSVRLASVGRHPARSEVKWVCLKHACISLCTNYG